MAASAWLFWLLVVTTYDLRQRRVPNWLVLAGAAGALAVLTADTQPFGVNWADAGMASALGFSVLLLFYMLRLMGAGDVKFAAVLGLWIGVQLLIQVWIAASLLAGLHAALWWVLRYRPMWPWVAQVIQHAPARPTDAEGLSKRPRPIPYAAYMALMAIGWAIWR